MIALKSLIFIKLLVLLLTMTQIDIVRFMKKVKDLYDLKRNQSIESLFFGLHCKRKKD